MSDVEGRNLAMMLEERTGIFKQWTSPLIRGCKDDETNKYQRKGLPEGAGSAH